MPHSTVLSGQRGQVRDLVLILFLKLAGVFVLSSFIRPSYFGTITGYAFINYLLVFLLNQKYPLNFTAGGSLPKFLQFVSFGAVFCAFINFPYRIWAGNIETLPQQITLFVNYGVLDKILFALVLCLVAPASEELLYRGFFHRLIKDRFDVFWGATVSTVLYTAFHRFEAVNLIYIAIPSLIYVYVYEKTNSVLSSVLTHSLNNSIWFAFAYWGSRGA